MKKQRVLDSGQSEVSGINWRHMKRTRLLCRHLMTNAICWVGMARRWLMGIAKLVLNSLFIQKFNFSIWKLYSMFLEFNICWFWSLICHFWSWVYWFRSLVCRKFHLSFQNFNLSIRKLYLVSLKFNLSFWILYLSILKFNICLFWNMNCQFRSLICRFKFNICSFWSLNLSSREFCLSLEI